MDSAAISVSNDWLDILPDVSAALVARDPVVAFETTVLSFGLPFPANRTVGQQCEKLARESGCVPATLGLLNGKACVGMTGEQMDIFCAPDNDVVKINLQNMSAGIARRQAGAFTVAASLQVCDAAGVRVFSTGGLGGVHRDFINSHDVSSDLIALARYPVAVVCAGVKSILDVPATLEHLESLGVPVIGYKTCKFPLFHARESKYKVETHSDSMEEIAAIARAHWAMGGRGIMVVTPVPEKHAIDPCELEGWIAGANRAAQIGRVTGKAVTPFLLKKLEEISHGKSITTNVALLENNAVTASGLARALTDAASR